VRLDALDSLSGYDNEPLRTFEEVVFVQTVLGCETLKSLFLCLIHRSVFMMIIKVTNLSIEYQPRCAGRHKCE
jgi:hypothetical protein